MNEEDYYKIAESWADLRSRLVDLDVVFKIYIQNPTCRHRDKVRKRILKCIKISRALNKKVIFQKQDYTSDYS